MRVFIVEPSAVTIDRSHGPKMVIGHAAALLNAKIGVQWIANVSCGLAIDDVRIHRRLRYTIYDDHRKKIGRWRRQVRKPYYWFLARHTRAMICRTLIEENVSRQDHLFVPTADWILVRAIDQLHRALRDRLPTLHFVVMYERAAWMTGGYPYRRMLDRLSSLRDSGASVFLYCETFKHARMLETAVGSPVQRFPFPSMPAARPRDRASHETFKIGALGGGRRDKGFALLPDIVEKFQERYRHDNVTFVIQRPRPEDRLENAETRLSQMSGVVLLDNQLDDAGYEAALSGCDILIFPYDKVVYDARGSGIVNEAVAREIPVICTRGISLEDQISLGNGLVAGTAEEFASAINSVICHLDDYNLKARAAARKYASELFNNPLVQRINKRKQPPYLAEQPIPTCA